MKHCDKCKREVFENEITWPGKEHNDICQDCWEAECSQSWWLMVNQLGLLGLLVVGYFGFYLF